MGKAIFALLAVATMGSLITPVIAQNALERRADRNVRQAERQAQRLGNRTNYYSDNTWKQVTPWVSRYDLRPVQRAANAVANTANTTANAAANARFGYSNQNTATTQNGWFYDYYATPYTTYNSRADNNNFYSSAYTFNDTDDDGAYDEFINYRDSDNKGRYDEYDEYSFSDAKRDAEKSERNDGLYDANRHTVSGKIEASKSAKVNGNVHTVVRVKSDREEPIVVDLGPTSSLANAKAEVGQDIVASGPLMQIGEKEVLMAETAKISSEEVIVARSAPKTSGIVLDTTTAEVQNGTHSLAIIKTENGNQLIDLGKADQLRAKIDAKSEVVVWGVPVQMKDQRVILAEKIEVDGQKYDIKRW